MQFGVTFYPDLYPKEIWDNEFLKLKKLGFDIVRFGEMSWDLIEPKENKFDFKLLDYALSLCEKHSIKVVLGVPVSQAPQWLIKKYPEVLHVASDGTKVPEYGPRPNACRNNKIFKKYAERVAYKLAKRYAKHPALLMWQIDNEPNFPPLDLTENKDYCHCKATNDAFVEWAKQKYKTIKNLNDSWGTNFWTGTFSDFLEITTPKVGMWEAGNPHIYLDWQRFKSDTLSKWLVNLKKIIKKFDKTHKIGTNSFTGLINRVADHNKIAKDMDWFGWDIYPKGTDNTLESLSLISDFWKSICRKHKAEFIVSELQGGANVRWGNPVHVGGNDIKEWVRLIAKKGPSIILFHNFRPNLFGSETGGFGILGPDGNETERSLALKEAINEAKDTSLNYSQKKTEETIAIYYSRSSDIETFQEEGVLRPCPPSWFSGRGDLGLFFSNNSLAGAYKIPYKNNLAVNFIFEDELALDIPTYKALLLVNPYILSQKELNSIIEYIKNGGKVFCESRLGLKDENGKLYQNPLVEKILPVKHLYTEIIEGDTSLSTLSSKVFGFRDVFDPKTAKVIETFSDSKPAVFEIEIGKGKLVYFAFSVYQTILKYGDEKLLSLIQKNL